MKNSIQYKTFQSPDEVQIWVKNNYTQEELNSLDVMQNMDSTLFYYKGADYRIINEYVRKHNEDQQSQFDINGMQALLMSKTICEDITVFRFVNIKEFFMLLKNTCLGKCYTYPHFMSTTLLKKQYSMSEKRKHRIAIKIRIPKGTKGTYLPEVNPEAPEYEVLLPFRIKLKRKFFTYTVV